jgi:hypothetical protein
MSSFTLSDSFSITHARHLAAKVATDLKRLQRFYDSPSDTSISAYEAELIEVLRAGYLDVATYGFRRNGEWIEPTIFYSARELAADLGRDDHPGRIPTDANVAGATFCTYMTYNSAWYALGENERVAFKKALPFERSGAPEPPVSGYTVTDRTYAAGGRALERKTVRAYR